jgi:4-hydroxy-3-polyprenylbenzoate decarboxylase
MCKPEEIHDRWTRAQLNPIDPVTVPSGPVQEVVWRGKDLLSGHGLDMIPVPISTPGFDNAPYFSSANWVTKDPDSGIYNMGVYRGQIKAPDRMGGSAAGQHLGQHWRKCMARGIPLECAVVVGPIPSVVYASTAKLPYDFNEYRLAGGLAGEPLELVKCVTVDLEVPATTELVIEGIIPTDWAEPEGPFGEYTGYMGQRGLNPYLEVANFLQARAAKLNILVPKKRFISISAMIRVFLLF